MNMFDYNLPQANNAGGSRFPSTGDQIIGPEKSVYKEISKNILLHKIQLPLSGAADGAEQKYVFKVILSSLFEILRLDLIYLDKGNRIFC